MGNMGLTYNFEFTGMEIHIPLNLVGYDIEFELDDIIKHGKEIDEQITVFGIK